MARKIYAGALVLLAVLALVQPSLAGRLTGSIKGKITDPKGSPLVGAHVYATSPALIGIQSLITQKTGGYNFLLLPPGTYKITIETPEYKTVNVESVVLSAGKTIRVDLRMEASEIEEEMTSRKPGSGLDRESARQAVVLDHDLIVRIPLARDFSSLLGLVPGVVFENDTPGDILSVHGGPATNNAFVDGGIQVTDPITGGSLSRINVDLVEQVVIETSALPVDRDSGQGAYINVVHKAGANRFDGSLFFTYTGKGLSNQLWPSQDLSAMPFVGPAADRSHYDLAFTAGGPVLKDIAWFFTNVRFQSKAQTTPFRTFTDPLGDVHQPYDFKDRDFSGTFKLTTRVLAKYQGYVEVGLSKIREPVYASDIAWNNPLSATRTLDSQSSFLAKGGVSYELSQTTVADLSLGYTTVKRPLLLNGEGSVEPTYNDIGTGYNFGGGLYNDRDKRQRLSAGATITRIQENLFGASHEFIAGADYESSSVNSSVWKLDNLVMPYLSGSPYNLGQAVSPYSGNTVGEGLIGFSIVPQAEGGLDIQRQIKHLGVFAEDTMTFGGRVSLSLGLRYDRSDIRFLAVSKGPSGNTIAATLGDTLIKPIYGLNPFLTGSFGERDGIIKWNTLSPRAGLSIDLLGKGKTLLRGSFARLPESLGLGYALNLDPFPPGRVHDFYWYDENRDGVVSAADTFVLAPFNYNVYRTTYFAERVDPKLRAPVMDEWTAGVEQEITRGFTLSLRYISRSTKNVVGDVLYDPDAETSWYSLQGSPAGRWVPFTTIVPGTGSFADTPVTVYFRSSSAPLEFDRLQNVPELSRKYRALEFTFRRQMSGNWQLFGSVVWSRSTGTIGPTSPWSMGLAAPVLTPNAFVNLDQSSRTDFDRPLAARVMGTVRFRWDIYLSLLYRFMSGVPSARSVSIIPPADWAAAHQADVTPVTVFLESPGVRRYETRQTTDLRLEKEFKHAGRTRLSLYVDVFNLFGNKYQLIDGNDGGTWAPVGEGAGAGERLLSRTYGQAIALSGTRTFQFSLSLRF